MKPIKTEMDQHHFQDMFFHIRNTTRIFDEIQFNYNCAKRDMKHFYPNDESLFPEQKDSCWQFLHDTKNFSVKNFSQTFLRSQSNNCLR